MLAYRAIARKMAEGVMLERGVSHALLECIVKTFKSHRCALDFDKKYIQSVVDEMQKIQSSEDG